MTLTRGLSLLVCEHSTSSVVVEHPSDDLDIPDPDAGCRAPGAVHAGRLIPQPWPV
jgi:hypothetical protein